MRHEVKPGQRLTITNETPGELVVRFQPMQSTVCFACEKRVSTILKFVDLPDHPGIPLCATHYDNLKAVSAFSGMPR